MMYNELINYLQRDLESGNYNKELLPFWIDNLNNSRSFDEEKQQIIVRVNEMYKKEKVEHHSKVSFLLGLIGFLNKINNHDAYSLLSLYFLGFYLSDYDNEELEKFVDAKISPKIINIISEKIDDLREKGSYLDYYQEKGDKILEDSTKKTNDEIREQIGYVENASFDRGYTHEIRRI